MNCYIFLQEKLIQLYCFCLTVFAHQEKQQAHLVDLCLMYNLYTKHSIDQRLSCIWKILWSTYHQEIDFGVWRCDVGIFYLIKFSWRWQNFKLIYQLSPKMIEMQIIGDFDKCLSIYPLTCWIYIIYFQSELKATAKLPVSLWFLFTGRRGI